MSKVAYRPDIDGLRAVAVVPVVLFHFRNSLVPGGFAGVDIFFVISGFLITAILLREARGQGIRLMEFYKRRALRILPPLFFMLLLVTMVSFVIMTSREMTALAKSLPFIATSTANLYFMTLTNYFDPDAGMNVLIHTWSLGVEEQFYIVYPLALLLCLRLGERWGRLAMLALVVVTFAANVFLVQTQHDKIAFYGFPFRAWELGLGALVAMGLAPDLKARWMREVLALAGMALIAVALITLSSATPFPGWAAATPALGATLVIAYGHETFVGRALGSLVPRVTGRISYSLYLWHWPVIVLAQHLVGERFGVMGTIVCFGLIIGAAVVSYQFVERPFRGPPWLTLSPARVLLGAGVVVVIFVAMGPLGQMAAPWTLPASNPEARVLARYADYNQRPDSMAAVRMHECFLLPDEPAGKAVDAARCLTPTGGKPAVLMLGDSHAAYLTPGLRAAYPEVDFLQRTVAGCTPVKDFRTGTPACQAQLDAIYGQHAASPNYRTVLLAARWNEADLPKLERSIEILKARGLNVVVIGPAIEYLTPLPDILARARLWPSLVTPDRFRKASRTELDETMARLVANAGATYVSQQKALCAGGQCPTLTAAGVPVSFDYGHYTLEGARAAGAAIRNREPGLQKKLTM
jgi:peptidoglycan/LPS O-acetylase OafA/YrhL